MRQCGVPLRPAGNLSDLRPVCALLANSQGDVPQNRPNRPKWNDPFIAPDKPAYVIHF